MQLDASVPADLDRTGSAGCSVDTATGGIGSEQKQAISPPIASRIVTGQSLPCPGNQPGGCIFSASV